MPCTPPRPFRSPALARFSSPGTKQSIYPPRRFRRAPEGQPLPNNANVCTPALAQRVFSPASLSFTSRSGSGSLIGWTPWRPTGETSADSDPAASWNSGPIYKYRRLAAYGAVGFFNDQRDHPTTPFSTVRKDSYGGSSAFDRVTGARTDLNLYGTAFFHEPSPAVPPDWFTLPVVLGAAAPGLPAIYTPPQGYVFTSSRLTVANTSTWPDPRTTHYSTCFFDFEDPDTFFDALARAGGATGAAAETVPGSVEIKVPSSAPMQVTTPTTFSGVTAVRATAVFSSAVPAGTYEVRGRYRLRPLGGGFSVEIPFLQPLTLALPAATVAQDVPTFAGHATSLVSLHLIRPSLA
jgi:hypothetical protein